MVAENRSTIGSSMNASENADDSLGSQEIRVVASDAELPSDLILKQIRSRTVKRGQFGIKTILILVTAAAFYFALPNIIGWEPEYYLMLQALFVWAFMPGFVYLIYRAGNIYGLTPHAVIINILLCIIVPVSIAIVISPNFLFMALLWVPQIVCLIWIDRLFKWPNRTAKNIQGIYDEAVGSSST